MAYRATVFNVMIASPSDVAAERALVKEVVHEWNAVNAFTRRIVLQPIGWETHSSPSMGEHPQHVLNEQVLAKCDLLVGVFWTRVGRERRSTKAALSRKSNGTSPPENRRCCISRTAQCTRIASILCNIRN